MGQCHYLANLTKKQVIHPHQIGNGVKLREQIGRPYATATALVMLLAASSKEGGRGGGDFRTRHPLVGSWAGDRVAFIGDYAEPDDIPGADAALIYKQCRAACAASPPETPPPGGQDWTNISAQVRAMMSAEFGIRYQGAGWLDIVDEQPQPAPMPRCPDLVLAPAARSGRT